jgi:hypothetical protein
MGMCWRRLGVQSVAVLCGVLMLNFVAGAQTNSATLSGTPQRYLPDVVACPLNTASIAACAHSSPWALETPIAPMT